eukprot:scaffold6647_cov166-Amphora_coffeaeformis.AAC.10
MFPLFGTQEEDGDSQSLAAFRQLQADRKSFIVIYPTTVCMRVERQVDPTADDVALQFLVCHMPRWMKIHASFPS